MIMIMIMMYLFILGYGRKGGWIDGKEDKYERIYFVSFFMR
jgi:hypothetical protein